MISTEDRNRHLIRAEARLAHVQSQEYAEFMTRSGQRHIIKMHIGFWQRRVNFLKNVLGMK
jgi:hypothetical protein